MGRLNFDSESDEFKLNSSALLELYDQNPNYDELGSPITAITSLIGEDLLLGLFDHYLRNKKGDAIVSLDYSCTNGRLRGRRLDAWIETKNNPEALYQTEVKNWCASDIGGRPITNTETLLDAAKHNRERYLNHTETAKKVWKVLLKMNPPEWYPEIKSLPLLAFWSPIAPEKEINSEDFLEPFFEVETQEFEKIILGSKLFTHNGSYAERVSIFSASNYLRRIKDCNVTVRMPRVKQRLEIMGKMGFSI
jgi:hypothetical protein